MTENPTTEQAPEPVGFGLAELTFLLSSFDGPGHARSVEALEAEGWVSDETLAQVGLSGLAARGFVEPGEQGLGIGGPASTVAHALGEGKLWISLRIDGDGEPSRVVLVEADGLRLLLQPGILNTWFATPVPEELTTSQIAVSVLHQHEEERPGNVATATVSTRERSSSYRLERDGEGWKITPVTGDVVDAVSGLGPGEVAALFDAAGL
ncbi:MULTISPECIES: hypothetical protein [Arthrobacter]|uniref:Alkylmercury lyase n=2 Tax=Arthrobacter TaxID=1663 RepID=A0ABU9KMM1_9MICC|nr:hypothetical protein [Arthrobacter sp. YJM1]MDP5227919.1 hypothetical protein [Arthrobacter sp. YJM1]